MTHLAALSTPIPRRADGLVELPLSALQQRIWFLCTAYPGTSSPILYLSWRLRGPLDVAAFLDAVSAVVNRHETLRTRFRARDGGAVQVFGPETGLVTERTDLTGLPEADREARARDLLLARTQALLDLEHGPLVGSTLVTLDDEHHVWCLTVHHILADGVSLEILSREVPEHYRALRDGVPPELAELPIRYGDFAVWQEEMRDTQADDLRYWRERLAGVPVLELPTDLPRPAEKGTRAAELVHRIDVTVAERLERLARAEGCTLFMVLLAALQAMLTLYSGQDDICVGTPVAGRTRVELEQVVGLFANTLPLRGDLSGNPTFRELLARIRTSAIDGLSRQTVPFGRIVAELDLPKDMSRTQVFQVIFVVHTEVETEHVTVPGLRAEPFGLSGPQILHDLVFHVWRGPTRLSTEYRYDSALFLPATVTAMAQRYEQILRNVCDNPDLRLFELAVAGFPAGAFDE
ncbi:MAG TPA: condensation domain-containing protein [Micromonosporaceae bacterium]|jgi:hypothetical protein|nr:condensation domain-containing protein [Micromonosporaceae bacterium]